MWLRIFFVLSVRKDTNLFEWLAAKDTLEKIYSERRLGDAIFRFGVHEKTHY